MKYISYKAFVLLALIALSGCKKDLLEKLPQDQISSATFWTSEKEARLALSGCYGYLMGKWGNVYDDGATDNAYAQYPWESSATVISNGDVNPSVDNGYGSRYTFIRRYNYFLDNVDKTPMDDNLKKRFMAEAKALRALTYFDLAGNFGAVPLLKNDYTDPQVTAIAPATEAEVIGFVIAELASAASDLPASYGGGTGNEKGRITKGAALSFKARAELYYAKWADAAATAQQVMGLGYSLFRVTSLTADDTKDDFSAFMSFANDAEKDKFYKGKASYEQQFWKKNKNNSEVILSSQSIATGESYSEYPNPLGTLLPPAALGGWSSITPTVELVNAYSDKNGNPFTPPSAAQRAADYNNGSPNAAYFNEFKNRDTRLYASVLFPSSPTVSYNAPGFLEFAWGKGGNNNSKTGYNFRKLTDPSAPQVEYDGDLDFPIIRYAEVLLTYAEAKNEASGPDASVYAALDDIRSRAGMPPVDQATYNTKDLLRQLIRNERRIELVGEGQRFLDIRRWNIAADVMKTTYDITNGIAQQRNWQAKFIKMPYPQGAVDRNPNLATAQTAKGY